MTRYRSFAYATNFTFSFLSGTIKMQIRLIGGTIMAQNLTYTQCGDYYIPDIRLVNVETQILGKYGRMRRAFLEQNRPMLFNDMILTESLFPHLWEVQQTCAMRIELLMTDLLAKNPAPDKATQ